MNLPKDWYKKPDWLDKAKEPSELGPSDHAHIWLFIVLAVAALAGLGLFLFSLFS